MKVMIPLEEEKKEICIAFGRAPFFLVHDTETNQSDILDNPAAQAQGGAGIQAAQFVVDHGADTLITVRCGENAGEVFQKAGIKIYKAQGVSVKENLDAHAANKLEPLTHFHAGFHGVR